jgi:hypothetical protein
VNAAARAGAVFDAAHRRSPLAVMPGHVMSPMDRECTVTIDSDLIASCQSAEAAAEPTGSEVQRPGGS